MAAPVLPCFSFTLRVVGPDLRADSHLDSLAEAGCLDATFSSYGSEQFADFDREADSESEAILTAIRDIQTAVPEVQSIQLWPFPKSDVAADFEEVGRLFRAGDTEGLLKRGAAARRARAEASAARAAGRDIVIADEA